MEMQYNDEAELFRQIDLLVSGGLNDEVLLSQLQTCRPQTLHSDSLCQEFQKSKEQRHLFSLLESTVCTLSSRSGNAPSTSSTIRSDHSVKSNHVPTLTACAPIESDDQRPARLYKTRFCSFGADCPYKAKGKCIYAHSRDEIRERPPPPVGYRSTNPSSPKSSASPKQAATVRSLPQTAPFAPPAPSVDNDSLVHAGGAYRVASPPLVPLDARWWPAESYTHEAYWSHKEGHLSTVSSSGSVSTDASGSPGRSALERMHGLSAQASVFVPLAERARSPYDHPVSPMNALYTPSF